MNRMIRWFAINDIAANLLMIFIVMFGCFMLITKIPLEVFPGFELDTVRIEVAYRGATPEEVEESVVLRIEESIQDLIGIEQMHSTASEGIAQINVEVSKGTDSRALLDDIKNRVDTISTFPEDIERPLFRLLEIRREVISVVISGNLPEKEIRQLGERIRDDITNLPEVTQVDLNETRPYEVSIDISESVLQQYGLTFNTISEAISRSSLDLPAGSIKADGGEILLRTKGQAYQGKEFERIPILTRDDGTRLYLGDIATVRDDFEEEPLLAWFNNKPCVVIDVFRVGDQNAIDVAQAVKDYVDLEKERLPAGITLNYWRDRSKIVHSRLNTLNRSAIQGGFLVFILLALTLRLKLALWVCLGIPVSFMGAIALMPFFGVTINIVSLFAFILVLGIVVDDAIVTAENIYSRLKTSGNSTEAAILGTQEVSVPVTFGVITTAVAFVPMLFMGGFRGAINAQIAQIVIPVLFFSLIESKLILPAHLKRMKVLDDTNDQLNFLQRIQTKIANGLESAIFRFYKPLLSVSLNRRYLTYSIILGISILWVSMVVSGRIRYLPFPIVPSEVARANLTMPLGTPFEITKGHIKRITETAEKLRQKYVDPETNKSLIRDILSTPGSQGGSRGQSHVGRVMFEIAPPEERTVEVTSSEIVREWRKLIGPIVGARELTFQAEIHRRGDPINVQLSGRNFEDLEDIAGRIKERLEEYPGVFDISDNIADGKEEIKLFLKPEAELLGLTVQDLGRQVRDAFFGREVQRIQRNRDDVRIMLRYPPSERRSIDNLATMRIRTSLGVEVPFETVAKAEIGRSFSTINRVDRNRTVNVTADIDKKTIDIRTIDQDLTSFLNEITADYPGIRFTLEGEARDQRDTFSTLKSGIIVVLFVIYALLAIPFKSYIQPFIVMSVIPFGVIGAIIGHWIMGIPISMFSIFGILALSGVVVNDSLVLVDYVNRRRQEGMSLFEAVRTGGVARFRAILLTSLTTFAGLTPLIFEKSTQAQFLIPMAVSLGFGILFATVITLIIIPINYLILEDVRKAIQKIWNLGNDRSEIKVTPSVLPD